jgi:hypothetical protein
MENKCSHIDCIAPQGNCHQGLELEECEYWGKSPIVTKKQVEQTDSTIIGWSGRPLGLEELTLIAARNKPRVIGILGPTNAGKTTLLGMVYSHLWHGGRFGSAQFAGSVSLTGWEDITDPLRWSDEFNPPQFPLHTELSEDRQPGLFHLALRQQNGILNDWLLTDAPGEWFKRWSLNDSAPEAEGANWIAHNSNVFVLVVDCDALSSPEHRGASRVAYQNLINRLGSVRGNRPVAVAWSKIDKLAGEEQLVAIKQYLSRYLDSYQEFKVSVKSEGEEYKPTVDEFERLFEWLNVARASGHFIQAPPAFSPEDSMLSFRG